MYNSLTDNVLNAYSWNVKIKQKLKNQLWNNFVPGN